MAAVRVRAVRACEACKLRKIKCEAVESQNDCAQCAHLGLPCHRSEPKPDARKRRHINRGVVINRIRGQSNDREPVNQRVSQPAVNGSSISTSPRLSTTSSSIFDNLHLHDLAREYSIRVFPSLPIITPSEFDAAIAVGESRDPESDALVHALAAVTINMTRVGPRHPLENKSHVTRLYRRSLELRGVVMPEMPVTLYSIVIPLLISMCLFSGRFNVDMGFYYLREALTRFLIFQRNLSNRFHTMDLMEREQALRLHWILCIHERYVAISHHRPCMLPLPSESPANDPTIDSQVVKDLNLIIDQYSIVDDDFLNFWLGGTDDSLLTLAWIDQKQRQLGLDFEEWDDRIASLQESQRIELTVTRFWLHTSIWQMALSKLLLTSAPDPGNDSISIMFPMQLGHHLRLTLEGMSPETIETHGTGIVQKIFDITATLADVLVHIPDTTYNGTTLRGYLNDFIFLYELLLKMCDYYPVEKWTLGAKLQALESRYLEFFGPLHWRTQT